MMTEPIETERELWVCLDCLMTAETAEVPADHPAGQPEPWALWAGEEQQRIVNNDWCGNDDCTDCQHGHRGFSWSSCDGCGATLGGERFRYALLSR